jgi:hypothetical protein
MFQNLSIGSSIFGMSCILLKDRSCKTHLTRNLCMVCMIHFFCNSLWGSECKFLLFHHTLSNINCCHCKLNKLMLYDHKTLLQGRFHTKHNLASQLSYTFRQIVRHQIEVLSIIHLDNHQLLHKQSTN